MKKYLMTGLAAMAIGIVLTSCSKNEADFTPPQQLTEYEKTLQQYADAFAETFGTPAANQTWGFAQATRTEMPNNNEWGTSNGAGYLNFPKPADITQEEREAVLAVFNEKGAMSYTSIIDVDSFFVQQVYCGPNGSKMNELATTVDYTRELVTHSWWPLDQEIVTTKCDPFDDIINNFNAGSYSGNQTQGCMLMYNSATKDFSFKTSQGGGQRWYNHWRMEKITVNGKVGYYVGFDHESAKQGSDANENELDVRDYIYNDWIIKIVPGLGYKEPQTDKIKESGRIICEDLGAVGDFDFNDVVFDATVYESGKAVITLLAAGGTLELSVAGKEVHEALMGAENAKKGSVYKMINTGVDAKAAPYTFEVSGISSLNSIPVIVKKTSAAGEITSYELSANKGQAPQKICVPTSFKWCKEYKSLKDAYPGFKSWANGDSSVWSASNDNPSLLYNAN
jgi:hypothetical protein